VDDFRRLWLLLLRIPPRLQRIGIRGEKHEALRSFKAREQSSASENNKPKDSRGRGRCVYFCFLNLLSTYGVVEPDVLLPVYDTLSIVALPRSFQESHSRLKQILAHVINAVT